MILSNLEFIPWTKVDIHYWIVNWSTVRSKNVWRDIMAWFKNIFGWELKGYTELLEESRKEAIERMKAQAVELGANAILNIRFSTSSITAWAAEIYTYWTAVKLSKVA